MNAKHPRPGPLLAALAATVVLAVAVLAPAIHLYFHADDFEWLRASAEALSRKDVMLPSDVNGHFRPAPELLWLLEYRAFGLDARPGHALAIALHLVVALLVAFTGARA